MKTISEIKCPNPPPPPPRSLNTVGDAASAFSLEKLQEAMAKLPPPLPKFAVVVDPAGKNNLMRGLEIKDMETNALPFDAVPVFCDLNEEEVMKTAKELQEKGYKVGVIIGNTCRIL